jgi:hypothetical protein
MVCQVVGSQGALNFEGFKAIMEKLHLDHLPLSRIFQVGR